MTYAHQPGSQPIDIPETIPNPVVKPQRTPAPQPPVKTPEKVPADHLSGHGRRKPLSRPPGNHLATSAQVRMSGVPNASGGAKRRHG